MPRAGSASRWNEAISLNQGQLCLPSSASLSGRPPKSLFQEMTLFLRNRFAILEVFSTLLDGIVQPAAGPDPCGRAQARRIHTEHRPEATRIRGWDVMAKYKSLFINFYGTLAWEDENILQIVFRNIQVNSRRECSLQEIGNYWWQSLSRLLLESYGRAYQSQRQLAWECLAETLVYFDSFSRPDDLLALQYANWETAESLQGCETVRGAGPPILSGLYFVEYGSGRYRGGSAPARFGGGRGHDERGCPRLQAAAGDIPLCSGAVRGKAGGCASYRRFLERRCGGRDERRNRYGLAEPEKQAGQLPAYPVHLQRSVSVVRSFAVSILSCIAAIIFPPEGSLLYLI